MFNNDLSTQEQLEQNHVFTPINVCCVKVIEKLMSHLFNHCNYTRDIYNILQSMDVWHTFPSSSFDLSFRDFIIMVKASLGLESIANLAIFWWFFWFAKNQIVFRDTTLSIFATTSRVTNFIRDWNGAHDNDRKLLLPYY